MDDELARKSAHLEVTHDTGNVRRHIAGQSVHLQTRPCTLGAGGTLRIRSGAKVMVVPMICGAESGAVHRRNNSDDESGSLHVTLAGDGNAIPLKRATPFDSDSINNSLDSAAM